MFALRPPMLVVCGSNDGLKQEWRKVGLLSNVRLCNPLAIVRMCQYYLVAQERVLSIAGPLD